MKYFIIVVVNIVCLSSCMGQNYVFDLSKEKIKEKNLAIKKYDRNKEWYGTIGYESGFLSMMRTDSADNITDFYQYNEFTSEMTKSDITVLGKNKKTLNAVKRDSVLIFSGYFHIPDSYLNKPFRKLYEYEYQDIWIQFKDTACMIQSFPYAFDEKSYDFKISENKKYLIGNSYYANIYLLARPEDNIIILYDLTEIKKGNVKENIIPCERCYNTYIINDTLIFGKELIMEDRSIECTYSNIYKAPIGNINDTTVIARDMELINITPDGKYILGKRKLHGKRLTVILDVAAKRYQYITGRNYHSKPSFYSYQMQKFAFDFGTHFVYVEFPDTYPYDAMIPYKIEWYSDADNKAFWKEHVLEEHKPLK